MKKIYVGMGLTQAPEAFRNDFQHELKAGLRVLPEVEVLDFIGVVLGTEGDVYQHDRKSTEDADLCVFIADYPSIGLGMEIAIRLEKKKPMLVFAREDVVVTRMLTGMCEKESIPFVRYQSAEDIVKRVEREL